MQSVERSVLVFGLVTAYAVAVCNGNAPNPLPAACNASKYVPPNAEAGKPVKLDLADIVAPIRATMHSTPLGDEFYGDDGVTHSVVLPDSRTADVNMYGFGLCADTVGITRQTDGWCGTTDGRGCIIFSQMAVQRTDGAGNPVTNGAGVPIWEYGVCLADPQPISSDVDYKLNNFGIMTINLSVPTTVQSSFTLADIDGHVFAREGASLWGIAANGTMILPSSMSIGGGLYGYVAELSAADGARIGMDMSSGPANIPWVEWVGSTTDTLDISAPAPYGPNSGVPQTTADKILADATFTFTEEVHAIGIAFAYAQNINDVTPTVQRVSHHEDIRTGITFRSDGVVGCSAPCSYKTSVASPVMKLLRVDPGGRTGTCDVHVRAATYYQYTPGSAIACAERYRSGWKAMAGARVDPRTNTIPCYLIEDTILKGIPIP
jgi:hypothetical protein